uniref:hypothetical protein n=1 Tax=Faecalibacterium sp. TaxID=1971605 RepID=UPI0040263A76
MKITEKRIADFWRKCLAKCARILYNKIMRGSAVRPKESGPRSRCKTGGRAVPAGRSRVPAKRHLSKGEYDYDLFAASTEYV